MDGFTYHDIFQTKGIEYIIIIGFLLLLIPFWITINKKAHIVSRIRNVIGSLTLEALKIRKGVFYSRNHMWTYLEKSGDARIGLDDLLLHITGDISLQFLKGPDEYVSKGELLAELLQDGKRLKVFSPISGQVTNLNPLVSESPELLFEDPYDEAWIYKVRPDNWVEETRSY